MLTKEAQIKGNKVATQRLREKAINSVGKEAIQVILKCKQDGMSLRAIANELNKKGYRTMTGMEFQQAQVKRTLDRINENPNLIDNVTHPVESVTVPSKRLETLQAELDKYKAMVDSLYEDNEKLRQTDIELKEVLKPFQAILENTNNPNQPRLQKLNEVVKAIQSVIDI